MAREGKGVHTFIYFIRTVNIFADKKKKKTTTITNWDEVKTGFFDGTASMPICVVVQSGSGQRIKTVKLFFLTIIYAAHRV